MSSKRIADTFGVINACTKIASNFIKLQTTNANIILKSSNWRWSVKYQPTYKESVYQHKQDNDIEEIDRLSKQEDKPKHENVVTSNDASIFENSSVEASTETIHETKIPKVLKESKMPNTRVSRLFHYGGLAIGLGIGALGESVKRATGVSDVKTSSVFVNEANIDRLVNKLSRMRGAALKLGQMLSIQGNDMLPGPLEQLILKVQDSANYMPGWQMEKIMLTELGQDWRKNFSSFDSNPIAAASIGQVHSAELASRQMKLAIKIQYPGIVASIDSDLANLKTLVKVSNLLPKGLYLDNTIKVARKELLWETDYIREAECVEKFQTLLKNDNNFVVPQVIKELSTKMVLVCERMMGEPLTYAVAYGQELRDQIGENILHLCLRELFEFKFMQTDPNWTNFFYNKKTRKIELIDFGASRSFDSTFIDNYLNILKSAAKGDREGCAYYSERIGFLTGYESEVMKNAHVDSILTLGEPFAAPIYDFSKQTITNRVRNFIPTMLKYRLTPPPDETYSLHRKLSGAFLLCAKLGSRVRCRKLLEEVVNEV
ncbi:ABC1-domain-containing protein [Gigaspora margarita]|uniref:ABC1-domain-containing protein n=1 Tax=Gigaspora margarita TaxID=4874 RepID=A0A8H3WZR5_GIGMA|nr:ABC1-domain-containing protein [Gigaspora margarita]